MSEFQGFIPRRIFDSLDGNFLISRIFQAGIFESKIAAPEAAARDRKEYRFRIVRIASAALEH